MRLIYLYTATVEKVTGVVREFGIGKLLVGGKPPHAPSQGAQDYLFLCQSRATVLNRQKRCALCHPASIRPRALLRRVAVSWRRPWRRDPFVPWSFSCKSRENKEPTSGLEPLACS